MKVIRMYPKTEEEKKLLHNLSSKYVFGSRRFQQEFNHKTSYIHLFGSHIYVNNEINSFLKKNTLSTFSILVEDDKFFMKIETPNDRKHSSKKSPKHSSPTHVEIEGNMLIDEQDLSDFHYLLDEPQEVPTSFKEQDLSDDLQNTSSSPRF